MTDLQKRLARYAEETKPGGVTLVPRGALTNPACQELMKQLHTAKCDALESRREVERLRKTVLLAARWFELNLSHAHPSTCRDIESMRDEMVKSLAEEGGK